MGEGKQKLKEQKYSKYVPIIVWRTSRTSVNLQPATVLRWVPTFLFFFLIRHDTYVLDQSDSPVPFLIRSGAKETRKKAQEVIRSQTRRLLCSKFVPLQRSPFVSIVSGNTLVRQNTPAPPLPHPPRRVVTFLVSWRRQAGRQAGITFKSQAPQDEIMRPKCNRDCPARPNRTEQMPHPSLRIQTFCERSNSKHNDAKWAGKGVGTPTLDRSAASGIKERKNSHAGLRFLLSTPCNKAAGRRRCADWSPRRDGVFDNSNIVSVLHETACWGFSSKTPSSEA